MSSCGPRSHWLFLNCSSQPPPCSPQAGTWPPAPATRASWHWLDMPGLWGHCSTLDHSRTAHKFPGMFPSAEAERTGQVPLSPVSGQVGGCFLPIAVTQSPGLVESQAHSPWLPGWRLKGELYKASNGQRFWVNGVTHCVVSCVSLCHVTWGSEVRLRFSCVRSLSFGAE